MTRNQNNLDQKRLQALLAERRNLKLVQEALTILCLLLASVLGILLISM